LMLVELNAIMTALCMFASVGGEAHDADSADECVMPSTWAKLGKRLFEITLASMIADLPVEFLHPINAREFLHFCPRDFKGMTRQRNIWKIADFLFYTLSGPYLLACVAYVTTFIANVLDGDAASTTYTLGITIVDKFILYPILIVVVLVILFGYITTLREARQHLGYRMHDHLGHKCKMLSQWSPDHLGSHGDDHIDDDWGRDNCFDESGVQAEPEPEDEDGIEPHWQQQNHGESDDAEKAKDVVMAEDRVLSNISEQDQFMGDQFVGCAFLAHDANIVMEFDNQAPEPLMKPSGTPLDAPPTRTMRFSPEDVTIVPIDSNENDAAQGIRRGNTAFGFVVPAVARTTLDPGQPPVISSRMTRSATSRSQRVVVFETSDDFNDPAKYEETLESHGIDSTRKNRCVRIESKTGEEIPFEQWANPKAVDFPIKIFLRRKKKETPMYQPECATSTEKMRASFHCASLTQDMDIVVAPEEPSPAAVKFAYRWMYKALHGKAWCSRCDTRKRCSLQQPSKCTRSLDKFALYIRFGGQPHRVAISDTTIEFPLCHKCGRVRRDKHTMRPDALAWLHDQKDVPPTATAPANILRRRSSKEAPPTATAPANIFERRSSNEKRGSSGSRSIAKDRRAMSTERTTRSQRRKPHPSSIQKAASSSSK